MNLKEVKINEGVEVINYGAFTDYISLRKINLPQTTRNLKGFAFQSTGN